MISTNIDKIEIWKKLDGVKSERHDIVFTLEAAETLIHNLAYDGHESFCVYSTPNPPNSEDDWAVISRCEYLRDIYKDCFID